MSKTIIEVHDLSYSFPDGKKALSNVSFNVYEGDRLGIIGANGAGKTTLLLHFNGVLQSSERSIKVFGMEVTKQNIFAIRSKVGLVFQNPDDQLFSPTVFEDVAFGPLNFGFPTEEVKVRVHNALEDTQMTGFEERIPHHLSTGEKKKIAISTVLSLPCELLVLDEPTSNLDPRSRRHFIELLKNMKRTMIVAGHDFELLSALCNRVIVLEAGRIVADDTFVNINNDTLAKERFGLS